MKAQRCQVANPPARPLILYDGDCGFCKWWVQRWEYITDGRVDFRPAAEERARFPEIPEEEFARAVFFFEPDGTCTRAAEAVFRLMTYSPRHRWLLRWYERVPGFATVTESGYRLVANHRTAAYRVTLWIWGKDPIPSKE